MKLFFLGLILSMNVMAADLPLVLEGQNPAGEPCSLTIEAWDFNPNLPKEWYALQVKARSNWQGADHESLYLVKSPSNLALYGKNNADKMSINLAAGKLDASDAVESYMFETRDETHKRFQDYCRIIKK